MTLNHEPELTAPVDLCGPDGRLNRAAVGWSRQPLQRLNVQGRWLAKKRWNYWAVTTPTHLFSATISNIDYIGMVFIYLGDFTTGRIYEKTIVTPFGAGCHMPEVVMADIAFKNQAMEVIMDQSPGGVEIKVNVADFEGAPLTAHLDIVYPAQHETLNVVIPWNERTFQFTAKHNTLPAQGSVRWKEGEIVFDGTDCFACLDYGRGIWPRSCAWNWGAASGCQGKHVVGLNLGGQWTDGTGMTENALCVDGVLSKVSEELVWEYDLQHSMQPWKIQAPETKQVDLTFTPFLERVASTDVGLIFSEVHQMFGSYSGVVRTHNGQEVVIEDLVGWAEDHKARW